MKRKIKAVVGYFLAIAQVLSPTYSAAQMSATGREAQSFGNNLAESVKSQGTNYKDGNLDIGAGNTIRIQDLFPGSSSSNSQPSSYYFPDGENGMSPATVEGLSGLHNNGSDMSKAGTSYNNSLLEDSRKDNPSLSGAAYQILRNQALKPKEKFENDPMLEQSRDVYRDMDLIAQGFSDCKVAESISQTTRPAHMPKYETCEVINKPAGDCEAINTTRIESSTHEVFVASQGRDVVTMRVDLKNGTWEAVQPSDGEAKTAKIPALDYQAICSGGAAYKTDHVGTWDWAGSGLPGDVDSSVDYTVVTPPTCENGLVGVLQIRDTASSDDLRYLLSGNFTFKFVKLIENYWSPDSCLAVVRGVNDGFCSGDVSKTENLDAQGCTTISSIKICPGDPFFNALAESPVPGVSKLAQSVAVRNSQCNFNVGQMDCWTDPQGKTQCPMNTGSKGSTCQPFKENPQCGFVSSKCVNGASGPSGTCYVYEETYDCGHSVNLPSYSNNTQYSCAGPIKCMGDECLDIRRESNGDFAQAAALLNAAQFMAQDMMCSASATSEGGDANVDLGCRVFAGEPGTCKIAVGGVQNCCEKPENVSLADYITMLMAVPKLDGAIMSLGDGSVAKGAYQVLRDPVMQGWTEISKPFASYGENISGAVTEFVQPLKQVYDEVMEQLTKAVQDVIQSAIESGLQSAGMEAGAAAGAANATAPEASSQAAKEIMSNIGGAASTIMTVYTVYVVTMMMIQIIWACEQEEFQLNAKRQLKSCTHVGSYCKTKVLGACVEKREAYCCFNSPLSRIVNEQIRTQKGWGFGQPENPQCEGLTLDQIGSVDWSKINLDEWLGILQETGHFPTPGGINLDSLTGSGSILNTTGNRLNAQDRATQRIDGLDAGKIRGRAETSIIIPK